MANDGRSAAQVDTEAPPLIYAARNVENIADSINPFSRFSTMELTTRLLNNISLRYTFATEEKKKRERTALSFLLSNKHEIPGDTC